ncbi:MAG TPA: hypothetical protein VND64_20660 [Pirellulales bacterium]|nr:hypothetical protein [Pirellulales bacterium]
MNSKENRERAFSIQGIDAALRRAALKARELGERTQTPVYVMREGRVVDLLTGTTWEPIAGEDQR